MSNHSYISPLHIIEKIEGTIPSLQELNLPRLRKKLSTMLELEEHPELTLNKKVYNKSELLILLEDLEDSSKREFHYRIFENKGLLNFLEAGNPEVFVNEPDLSITDKEEELKEFISPFFSVAYDKLFFEAIQKKNYKLLIILKNVKIPVSSFYESQCFQSTYLHLIKRNNQLKEILASDLSDKKKAQKINEVLGIENYEYFKYLPSYLAHTKTKYALQVAEILNLLFKHNLIDGNFAQRIYLRILTGINTQENINQLKNLRTEFEVLYKREKTAKRITTYLVLGIIAFFILITVVPKLMENHDLDQRKEAIRSYDLNTLFKSVENNSNNSVDASTKIKEASFSTGKDIYPLIFKPSEEKEHDSTYWVKISNFSSQSVIALIYPVIAHDDTPSNWKRSAFIKPFDSLRVKGFPAGFYQIAFYTGKYWSDTLTIFSGSIEDSYNHKREKVFLRGGFVSIKKDSITSPKISRPFEFCPNCSYMAGMADDGRFVSKHTCHHYVIYEDSISDNKIDVED